jgi:hypothetical protein
MTHEPTLAYCATCPASRIPCNAHATAITCTYC